MAPYLAAMIASMGGATGLAAKRRKEEK
ncbi:MAG: hypothetical protein LUC95_05430 [Lachnospiraceae bacterium]|nr:hypothetical protein [Lachnospiraceae bacterium]